jgi:hypothetical protein
MEVTEPLGVEAFPASATVTLRLLNVPVVPPTGLAEQLPRFALATHPNPGGKLFGTKV